jgi:DNA-directed RNA polymerase specialized sigma24 family protein
MNFSWPSALQGLYFHRCLCDGEASAPSDFAVAYTDLLYAWLTAKNPGVDEDWCQDAVHRAVLALIHRPGTYDPARGELAAYLQMSAQGDLRNVQRREGRHHQGRVPWKNVEEAAEAGKFLERSDDPVARTSDDDKARRGAAVLAAVREALAEPEKRTAAFAVAAGLSDLPPREQAREVKRVKDRIKKRIERAGGGL